MNINNRTTANMKSCFYSHKNEMNRYKLKVNSSGGLNKHVTHFLNTEPVCHFKHLVRRCACSSCLINHRKSGVLEARLDACYYICAGNA